MKSILLPISLTITMLFFIQFGFSQDKQKDPANKIIRNLGRIEHLYFKYLNVHERREAVRLLNETRSLVVENQNADQTQKDFNILSEEGFQSLMDNVKNESSDRSRTKIILSIGKKGKITSAQLAQLVALYKFDSEREEMVKSISDNIIDPVNIGVALKHFDSSSSKEKLADYFRNK